MALEKLARVNSLSESVIEDEKNSNNLIDLLEYLSCDDPGLMKAAVDGLTRAYSHFINKHYSWLLAGASDGSGAAAQYRAWLRNSYSLYQDKLLEHLQHTDSAVKSAVLSSLVKLVEAEGLAHQKTTKNYCFPNALFHKIVSCILSSCDDELIGCFSHGFLHYADVRYHWLKNTASIISVRVDTEAVEASSPVFIKSCHSALKTVTMASTDDELTLFLCGSPPQLSEDPDCPPRAKRKRGESKALDVSTLLKHKKWFSKAWLSFLRFPLSPSLCKQVLVSLHTSVIPHMTDPRLLLDFLSLAYTQGGVLGLLALNGLFLLMNKYHLDYPDFYTKLYQLVTPSVFHVKYMERFFHLLDTFLQSTHLALYLVAAFAKKVARYCLSAPPNGVMVGAVFVCNLIKRHPNCKVLLHRVEQTESSDVFDQSELDPAKCSALESSLWELKTLQRHYCPAVCQLMAELLDPTAAHSKLETPLNKYLDVDNDQIFQESCSEITNNVAMNFAPTNTLWPDNF